VGILDVIDFVFSTHHASAVSGTPLLKGSYRGLCGGGTACPLGG
jgi:hypothetical protein